jgi:hypothetical protein|tara:strand:+ start:5281 stop:6699 length:1419 start_codon:yes stop_codon:yes gene_type:complete
MPKVTEPTIEVTAHDSFNPITVSLAKKLLGWEVVEKGQGLFRDLEGNQIQCSNNLDNRPLYRSNYEKLKQEILRGYWRLNGEPIIIGEGGKVLNGQHSLIALVLSSQEVTANPELWEDVWEEEPHLEKVIVYGISEDDDVVNTMDTCKPRSLADVIYRSGYFKTLSVGDRKKASKTADFAIRLLWDRTGGGIGDSYGVKRTHSESLDMIDRHNRLLECVSVIQGMEGGTEAKLSRFLPLGSISGLFYLMATSTSSSSEYYEEGATRSEDTLNFDLWEEALKFWEGMISDPSLEAVRKALSKLIVDGDSTAKAKVAILVKGWECFVEGKKITAAKLKLRYEEDKHGTPRLAETPTVGGIDLGTPTELPEEVDAEEEEEMEQRKEEIKKESVKRKATEERPVKTRKRNGKVREFDVGDTVWALGEEEDSHWQGEVTEVYGAGETKTAKLKVCNGFAGSGNIYEHPYNKIQVEKP